MATSLSEATSLDAEGRIIGSKLADVASLLQLANKVKVDNNSQPPKKIEMS
jgi:hypothetical protein